MDGSKVVVLAGVSIAMVMVMLSSTLGCLCEGLAASVQTPMFSLSLDPREAMLFLYCIGSTQPGFRLSAPG